MVLLKKFHLARRTTKRNTRCCPASGKQKSSLYRKNYNKYLCNFFILFSFAVIANMNIGWIAYFIFLVVSQSVIISYKWWKCGDPSISSNHLYNFKFLKREMMCNSAVIIIMKVMVAKQNTATVLLPQKNNHHHRHQFFYIFCINSFFEEKSQDK